MKRITILCAVLLTLGAFSAFAESDAGIKGAEGGAAKLYLYADQGDDAGDKAYIEMQADGELAINIEATEVAKFDGKAGNLTLIGSLTQPTVVVADTNAYTVLAADAGKTLFIPDLTADITITMPAEAADQHYKFVYMGGAADAQDWIIDTGADANYFVGGVTCLDPDDGDVLPVYSDGNSNSKMGLLTPAAGTVVEAWCEDGTTWYVSGTAITATDTGITFADQ